MARWALVAGALLGGAPLAGAWRWPAAEEWLLVADGAQQGAAGGEAEGLRRSVERVDALCAKRGVEEPSCEVFRERVAAAARETPVGQARFVPVQVNSTVVVSVGMRGTSGVKSNAQLAVPVDAEPEPIVRGFCRSHQLNDGDCDSLVASTDRAMEEQRERLRSNVAARFEEAAERVHAIMEGTSSWQDVVLAKHHIDAVLAVDPDSCPALFLRGSLFSEGSRSAAVAKQLNASNGTALLEEAAANYEACARVYAARDEERIARADGTDVGLSAEEKLDRAKLFHKLGMAYFHLAQLAPAEDMLRRAVEVAEAAATSGGHRVASLVLRVAALDLAVMLANTDRHDAADAALVVIARAEAAREGTDLPPLLSPAEKLSVELFRATLFPFVYEDAAEAERCVRRSIARLSAIEHRLTTGGFAAAVASPLASLQRYLGFYSIYAGAPLGGAAERALREQLARVHALATPSLVHDAAQLEPRDRGGGGGAAAAPLRRVGFLSSYLFDHSVGKLLCETIRAIVNATDAFEVVVVQVGNAGQVQAQPGACRGLWQAARSDADGAQRLRGLELDFELTHRGLAEARDKLAALQLDVLVYGEVGLSVWTYFLAFARLAPVQLAFWGHPLTPGLPGSLDAAITSRKFLPGTPAFEDRERQRCSRELHATTPGMVPFSEAVVCLDTLGTAFPAPPPVSAAAEAEARRLAQAALAAAGLGSEEAEQARLYYLPHKLMKLHPRMDDALARIAERDPRAVVLLLRGENVAEGAFSVFEFARAKLERRLRARGVRRIAWLPAMPTSVFLAMGRVAHATLESFGSFGSGVTALEFLAAGVPVVGLAAEQRVAPNSLGMYRVLAEALGEDQAWLASELSCAHESASAAADCFVEQAVRVAADPDLRARWRDLLESDAARAALFGSAAAVGAEWSALLQREHRDARLAWRADPHPDADAGMGGLGKARPPQPEPLQGALSDAPPEGAVRAAPTDGRFVQHFIQLKDLVRLDT